MLVAFPICPYVLSPDSHTVPSCLIIPILNDALSHILFPDIKDIISVTSVPFEFNITIGYDEFVVVPLLNCPLVLHPVIYNFPSVPINWRFFEPALIFFAVTTVVSSNFICVNVVLLFVSPNPNWPYSLPPDDQIVPSSFNIYPEHPLSSISTISSPIHLSAVALPVVPFPNAPL